MRRTPTLPPSSLRSRLRDAFPRACAHAWPRPCPSSPAPLAVREEATRRPKDPPTQRSTYALLGYRGALRSFDAAQPQRTWGGDRGGAGSEAEAGWAGSEVTCVNTLHVELSLRQKGGATDSEEGGG